VTVDAFRIRRVGPDMDHDGSPRNGLPPSERQ
jgi:hypothetical protein